MLFLFIFRDKNKPFNEKYNERSMILMTILAVTLIALGVFILLKKD